MDEAALAFLFIIATPVFLVVLAITLWRDHKRGAWHPADARTIRDPYVWLTLALSALLALLMLRLGLVQFP